MTGADVLVAGCGPVGGVLAALLGSRGVRTVVVEPQAQAYPKPRAAVLDAEVLRVLAAVPGLGPAAAWSTPMRRANVLGPGRRPLFTVEAVPHVTGYPSGIFLRQPALEAALRDALRALPAVEVVTDSVRTVEQSPGGVVAGLAGGRRLTARWLVGCDGTGSTVRQQAGIAFAGSSFHQPWLVVDASAPDGADLPTFSYVLDPARPMVAFDLPGRRRWEWMLLPGEDSAAMTRPERLRRLVEPWTDPDALTVERAAVFTFHARTAARWRAGRVLLAGDAAHAMPPFVGAGLGMGLHDAAALAWRLADVVHGVATPETLDGYERERRPDVARTTAMAIRVGRLLQTRNRALSAVLRSLVRGVGAVPGVRRQAARPLPLRRLPRRVAGELRRAGRALPNPRVRVAGAESRLDDLLGYRWAVLAHGYDPRTRLDPGTREWAREHDAVVLAVHGPGEPAPGVGPGCRVAEVLDAGLDRRGITVARPDRFLLGVLDPTPS